MRAGLCLCLRAESSDEHVGRARRIWIETRDDEQTVEFTEDTSRDLLTNLDRINLSGFERTED